MALSFLHHLCSTILRKSQFIKHLNHLSESELRDEILTLFDNVPEIKTYYTMELGSEADRKKIYDKAKKEIASKYTTKSIYNPRPPRIQKINAILSNMKRKSIFAHEMVDLYLYDVEMALEFSRKYDFSTLTLSNHIAKSYKAACDIINEQQIHSEYAQYCFDLLEVSMNLSYTYVDLDPIYMSAFSIHGI